MDFEDKCIYCNKGISEGVELSESDIIPDALSRKRIINNNVCKIEHNNKFSDKFESYVINNLEQLRNHLGIPGKSNKIPAYSAKYVIGNTVLTKKLTNKADFFTGKIIQGTNGGKKVLLGDIENLQRLKGYSPEKVEILDFNNIEILQRIDIDLSLFFSNEMLRLAAKVGYEWFCKIFNINGVRPGYIEIINFIVDGATDAGDIVTIITDKDIYNMLNNQLDYGSHALTIYDSSDGNTYVLFSFFGLIIYKIRIKSQDKEIPDWQKVSFYGIRYDGSEANVQAVMNVNVKLQSDQPKSAILKMKSLILKSYQIIFKTQLFTLKNFIVTIRNIQKIINEKTGDELFNNLLGFKEDKKLMAIFVLYMIGYKRSSYDFKKSFNDNLRSILDIDETLKFNEGQLFTQLSELFYKDSLLEDVKYGIDICNQEYEKTNSSKLQ